MILKDIPGFEGYYQINENGEVFSVDRSVFRKDGSIAKYKGRMLKPQKRNGYYQCRLTRSLGFYHTISIHRIVAKLWIPNPDNLPQINHKDLNKTNNNFNNLEWTTVGNNIRHYINHGRKPNKAWSLVLCLRTGIYYESKGQAAKARGLNLHKDHLSKHDLLYCGNTID